ncbi:RnfH family protein [Dokdonella sp.]|uniref:RnfH family protein n=1 Tax=Dokdonella sp. TaxID=2291710 RepID=UPI001B0473B2|nr:RnfH family protein [Dokdonella sp.]MBO9662603.1 RnfH family protein [Dokdonella sp.]
MADPHDSIAVEVAYAEPQRQFLRRVELRSGATVADAIHASEVERECAIDPAALAIGIWSKAVDRGALLRDGDRVELYRPLQVDPKEARRRRAERAPLKPKR